MGLLQQYIKDPSSVDPWFELPKNSNMNPAFENSELGVGNTNYFDLHYKDWAFKQNHNLSLSGGGKKHNIIFLVVIIRKMVFSVMPIWISAVIILPLIFLLRLPIG